MFDQCAIESTEDSRWTIGRGWEGKINLRDFISVYFASVGNPVRDSNGSIVKECGSARRVLNRGSDDARWGESDICRGC